MSEFDDMSDGGLGPKTGRECDGPACNSDLRICPPVINGQHDLAFCSLDCRADWMNENEGIV